MTRSSDPLPDPDPAAAPRPAAGWKRDILGPAEEPLAGVIALRGAVGLAAAALGRRIVAGEWPPGGAIPREADLGATLGVSRSVVREAVRVLGAKGLVRSRT